ncbi:helix-turn-helix domain-containing protein [Ponticaulis sp.]|uniref:helix-turn-helix transcriptional regulator n=1 Tax=Ponticaulis sp. TaxID=2020902 RepID=UPI000B725CE5|nr:helix-turn-helix domain-containing protein [Ponticaulis sp.]MAJ09567.1 excisionase [Ponticaulis sp.]RPG18908.1 MAG: DNA-binding protein [Hyphomonadaceae bacterium TMED125]
MSNLIDTTELARRIDVSEVTLARMRMQGDGPAFIRIGRSVKYRWEDVEAWLKKQTRHSTSEAA